MKPPQLLIVDNEDTILFALKRYFAKLCYRVDLASELEEAEALLAHTCYDLVNNRNFDCNAQSQPSGKPSPAAPKTPPADSGLREQLRRSLGSIN